MSNYWKNVYSFQALKQLPKERIQVATKFGIVDIGHAGMIGIVDLGHAGLIVKGTSECVRSCCEASLKCSDVDYIDLYYQQSGRISPHRGNCEWFIFCSG